MPETLVYISDNLLWCRNLQNQLDDAYKNAATVTARVLDPAGDEIGGVSWPITLNYQSGTDGIYVGTLPDTMTTTMGDLVTVEVTADAGAGLRRVFTFAAFVDN